MGKKIRVSYFFMKNPYMKFQNPSMHGSEVILCIKSVTDGRTGGRTHKRPRSNMLLQLLRSKATIAKHISYEELTITKQKYAVEITNIQAKNYKAGTAWEWVAETTYRVFN